MPDALGTTPALARETNLAPGAVHPRIVFLTNIIPPYHKPVLDRLAQRFAHFRILLSTPMESNRPWPLDWAGLDVVVQKTFSFQGLWRHPQGFQERLYLHLPVDTISQLRRFHADVVVSWEMGTRTMLAAIYRLLHPKTKLIVWAEFAESTEFGRGPMRQRIRKVLHPFVDAFLVTGQSGARYLRAIGVPNHKIFKISYTTDIRRFSATPVTRPPESAWRLLYVGQLIERKGLLQFLSVLSRWAAAHPDRRLEFLFAGDGPLRDSLQHASKSPNVKLTFLGNVAYHDLPGVYALAGLFVLPTFADTWGVVVNEAMASALPVLGSLYGQAVSELVADQETGWTFRPDVDSEVYAAIDRSLTASVEQLDGMRARARQTASRLTPDYVADLIAQAILSCGTSNESSSG